MTDGQEIKAHEVAVQVVPVLVGKGHSMAAAMQPDGDWHGERQRKN